MPETEAGGRERKLEQILCSCMVRKIILVSIISLCSNFKRLYKNERNKKKNLIIPSNQHLSLITNRHHSNYNLRSSDDGIYYLGHLLAEEKAH